MLYTFHPFISYTTSKMSKLACAEYLKVSRMGGFIATTAVIVLAMGSLAVLLAAYMSVSVYVDMVGRREYRIQKRLNAQVCKEILPILLAKNTFLPESTYLSDFGCSVHR